MLFSGPACGAVFREWRVIEQYENAPQAGPLNTAKRGIEAFSRSLGTTFSEVFRWIENDLHEIHLLLANPTPSGTPRHPARTFPTRPVCTASAPKATSLTPAWWMP